MTDWISAHPFITFAIGAAIVAMYAAVVIWRDVGCGDEDCTLCHQTKTKVTRRAQVIRSRRFASKRARGNAGPNPARDTR